MSLSEARLSSDGGAVEAPAPPMNQTAPMSQSATAARTSEFGDDQLVHSNDGSARKHRSTGAAAAENPTATEKTRDMLPPLASFGDLVRDAPAWLFSAILHMIVLIVLGLWLIAQPGNPGLIVQLNARDDIGDDIETSEMDFSIDLDQPPIENTEQTQLPDLVDVNVTETLVKPVGLAGLTPTANAPAIRLGMSGREAGMKASLLAAYGGTAETEEAVYEGLAWLARYQDSRTSLWNLSGKYANGVNRDNPEAATALALIAFQGAGYTPDFDHKDPFTRVVAQGWKALLKKQQDNGNFFNSGTTHGTLYTHALCSIALCELYGMTGDEQYRDAAQLAIDYCVETQSEGGGWRYFPGQAGDLSVTGWFVMALQSARMAGLDVPSETLTRVGEFLDTVSRDGGSQYAYTPGQRQTLPMTAEGLLSRQYLGWQHDDPRLIRGADVLVKNLPSWQDRGAYYWYYAAQVCHHMEGRHWRQWNAVMRELLPAKQVKKGRERGSWDPLGDPGNSQGGRHFVTCLSIYMLEVYYRHLPIYQLDLLSGK